jgi:hypothetical protein
MLCGNEVRTCGRLWSSGVGRELERKLLKQRENAYSVGGGVNPKTSIIVVIRLISVD